MAYVNLRVHEVTGWDGKSEGLPPTDDVVFEIEKAEQGQSSKKGTPQLTLECRVMWPESLEGRKGYARYFLLDSKGSRSRLRQIVDATGIQMDPNGGFDDQEFVGKYFTADIINEPYEVVDATTGTKITKDSARIVNERQYVPADETQAAQPAAAAPPPAAAPAPQAPAAAAPNAGAAKPKFGRPASGLTLVS